MLSLISSVEEPRQSEKIILTYSANPVPMSRVEYFWNMNTRGTSSTRSISGLFTFGHFHTRTISGFDTVVTPCTWSIRGSILLNSARTLSIPGFCTAHTLTTRSIKIP